MKAFKSIWDYVNVDKITRDVQSAIDDKTDGLLSDFKSGDLDPDKLEGQIAKAEEAIKPFEDATNQLNIASKIYGAMKDPVGSAKSLVVEGVTKALNEVPQVQEIKSQIMDKVQEKIMEIPQVKKFKEDAEAQLNGAFSTDIPSNVEDVMNDPEQFAPSIPGVDAIIEKIKRESGYGKHELTGR